MYMNQPAPSMPNKPSQVDHISDCVLSTLHLFAVNVVHFSVKHPKQTPCKQQADQLPILQYDHRLSAVICQSLYAHL